MRVFLLIETAAGKSKEVTTALKQLAEVESTNMVTGPYDVIAIVEGTNLNDIGDLVTAKIHPITGINRTVMCITK